MTAAGTYADQVRENYKRLREAGFTSEEARKLRSKGREEVEKSIRVKKGLPDPPPVESEGGAVGRGNPARRITPEEGLLLDSIRAIGMQPKVLLHILAAKMEDWVDMWAQAGEVHMADNTKVQLERVREFLK